MTVNGNLKFPRVKENGLAIPIGSEAFVNIHPLVTLADRSIERYAPVSVFAMFFIINFGDGFMCKMQIIFVT